MKHASRLCQTYSMSTKNTLLFLSILIPFILKSQTCDLKLSGQVLDLGTEIPLPYANIFLEDQKIGVTADARGFFKIENLCPAEYHVQISHIGCEGTTQYLRIEKDTIIKVYLHHHAELLDEVVVHSSRADNSAQSSATVGRQEIEQSSNKNLADILENISGVSVLKNGSGISKPVIHGLFGNRVAILNNGIEQAGQQWGGDHAPEIDPYFANHLSVIKGASALAHGSNALGSVVLVEVDPVREDPHLHGGVNYVFQSNGRGHTLNAQLEKNSPWAAWRISGTMKRHGDTKTPDYFLTNTGKREYNLALQLEKKINDRWSNELYLSSFNTEIGVLRGSHIGNLTDLESALDQDVPFFTEETFSDSIKSPKQKVGHHLLKFESKYFLNEEQVLKFKYGGQLNDRKEFDVRRGGRSNIPALSLQQYAHFTELSYNHTLDSDALLKTGLQYRFVDNSNDSGTGILPLIPDYDSHIASTFLVFQKTKEKLFWEAGGRYSFKNLEVATISQSLPRRIERFTHNFHNYAFSLGGKYAFSKSLKLNLDLGYMQRAPEVNELYSAGLHQGVSGIEEGDRNLKSETSFKGVFSLDWYFKNKLFVQALGYYQTFQDYIYLQPQDDFRLTIRGAFPVFIYQQTDAKIYGADVLISVEPTESTKWLFKYAHIQGRDQTNGLDLINIPADNIYSSFTFSLKDYKSFKQSSLALHGRYVFQKKGILEEQDFQETPAAYFLLGMNAGTTWQLEEASIRFSINVENMLNEQYRDYLNRLRYFADDTGFNLSFNIKYEF